MFCFGSRSQIWFMLRLIISVSAPAPRPAPSPLAAVVVVPAGPERKERNERASAVCTRPYVAQQLHGTELNISSSIQ